MTKFTASRLSEGNNLFPASITIDDDGLEIRIPGFLKNEETFIAYEDISGVSIETPLVGYSSISFRYAGTRMSAHGFSKKEVKAVKEAISAGKKDAKSSRGKEVKAKDPVRRVVKEKNPAGVSEAHEVKARETEFVSYREEQQSNTAGQSNKLGTGSIVAITVVGGIGVVMVVMFYMWIISLF